MRSTIAKITGSLLTAILFFSTNAHAGPYAPAPGQPGSTAIDKDDPRFVGWASGWKNYIIGTNVVLEWQTPEKALGKAVGDSFDIVSLGRGGEITMTFDNAIKDGPGWDFAVFENSVTDTFLELGYVEVSSNGVDFFRFQNNSLTADPIGGFGTVDPTDITGFGGKYRQGYGTPFDLADMAEVDPLLDINSIKYVKIVDIVGDGTYLDTSGGVIYDPYPTFESAGFDLDAVGVIHQQAPPSVPAISAWGFLLAALFLLFSGVTISRRQSRNAEVH